MLRQIEWEYKIDLSQRTEFSLSLLYFVENLINVPTTQMSIFILFISTSVLFEGAFSLRVFLITGINNKRKKIAKERKSV